MFGVILDSGAHIGRIWTLTIPEGLKEVLWKEMNGAQVLGHRYYGTGLAKLDMGCYCLCSDEMKLQHILLGCRAYELQPLLELLTTTLRKVSPDNNFKSLHPDEWGWSPWYPLLALGEIEEAALPMFKGQKGVLRALRRTRQRREWVIGNYYWALWKWRMKEIHEDNFKFIPRLCESLMEQKLLTPVPAHLLKREAGDDEKDEAPSAKVRLTDNAYG